MSEKIRIVFMGTAPLARESLRALLEANQFNIVGVVSQPDRPAGRKMKLQPTPVKSLAVEAGLDVFQPERIKKFEAQEKLFSWKPELIVVAAYGQILPESILHFPRYGCINVHASILPFYRGAAPIQWAIYDQQKETGITIMKMDKGMDTGDMISVVATPIGENETSGELHDRLALIGGELLVKTIPDYCSGIVSPKPQDHSLATHARKIEKEDGNINWNKSSSQIHSQIMAFSPWPGSYSWILNDDEKESRQFKVWLTKKHTPLTEVNHEPGKVIEASKSRVLVSVGTNQVIELVEVQFPGSKRLPIQAVQASNAFQEGMRLGSMS